MPSLLTKGEGIRGCVAGLVVIGRVVAEVGVEISPLRCRYGRHDEWVVTAVRIFGGEMGGWRLLCRRLLGLVGSALIGSS